MEQRKQFTAKPSSLPKDYLQMVSDTFSVHFDEGLKIYSQSKKNPHFRARGEIFPDEILLAVSLLAENQISGTTVYASSDFDPKASAPILEDLLSACVDAIGSIFGQLLDPTHPEAITLLAEEPHSALQELPLLWTSIESDGKRIFIKIDQSNPLLDDAANEWLSKHDPEFLEREAEEQKETENLFVTGPRRK